MQPNQNPYNPQPLPSQPGEQPLAPPDPNQTYSPAPPVFGQPQPYIPQQQPAPVNPFDTPPDRSHRAPSAFEQRFHEYVVASTNSAPTKKPRKAWPVVLVILFLLLALGGAGAYYWYVNLRMTPEKRFNLALENHLRVSTIGQDYEMQTNELGQDLSVNLHSIMNISDIKKPQAVGDYTLTGYDQSPRDIKFAFADKTTGYISYTKLSAPTDRMPVLNSWYQYDPSNALTGLTVDPVQVNKMIPVTTGEVIVGSFSDMQRQQIMQQIATHNPYTIVSSKDEGSTVHYVVSYDVTRLNALNKLAAGMSGGDTSQDFVTSHTPAQADLWVDKSTNHFVKSTESKDKDTVTVTITYPTDKTVTMPKPDHTVADLYKALLGSSFSDVMFAN